MKTATLFRMLLILLASSLVGTEICSGETTVRTGRIATFLAQSRTALGGASLGRKTLLKITANISVGGLSGTQVSWREMGGMRFAESSVVPPFKEGGGYDGKDAWNQDSSSLVWVDGGDTGRAQAIGLAFVANDALWSAGQGGAELVWGGPRTAAGRTYDALIVTPRGAVVPFELWFDPKTHLPMQYVQQIGPNAVTKSFSDYRSVDGLMIPFKVHSVDLDGNSTDLNVVSVATDAGDGAAHLRKPVSEVHDFSIAGGLTRTSVTMDLVDSHVIVPVMLNGKGPYRFVVDTGGENVVDPAVAQEIGAIGRGSLLGSGSGTATPSLSIARIDTLQIGAATLKNQLFSVAPIRAGFGVSSGQPVDGLVGFEVLARFVTTFDYGNRRVILRLPENHQAPPAGEAIPFVLDGRLPQFACMINTIGGQCTLDTGSRGSVGLYGPFISAHPQVVPAAHSYVGVNGFGFGGPSFGQLGRLQTFRVGPFTLSGVVADFTSDENGTMALPFVAGNVGGNIWRRFALTLDYNKLSMTLVPNDEYLAPDVYERAGLFLVNRDGKYVVLDARPGAAAVAAGIAKGDIIESINGVQAATMSLQAVRNLFLNAPGTRLTLGLIDKDGIRRNATLTLRDLV